MLYTEQKIVKNSLSEKEGGHVETEEQIEAHVVEIVAQQLKINVERVTPEAHLEKDLGIDSIDKTLIIMRTEEDFHIRLLGTDIQKFATIQDIIGYLKENWDQRNITS
jgi:acyl carrier protein